MRGQRPNTEECHDCHCIWHFHEARFYILHMWFIVITTNVPYFCKLILRVRITIMLPSPQWQQCEILEMIRTMWSAWPQLRASPWHTKKVALSGELLVAMETLFHRSTVAVMWKSLSGWTQNDMTFHEWEPSCIIYEIMQVGSHKKSHQNVEATINAQQKCLSYKMNLKNPIYLNHFKLMV